MATFRELTAEWVRISCVNKDCSDADLQLAAELGKTLLERNKELETNLRQQQNVVEDRNQEIEYLTKQTAALREVNDSRLRIYEQLEISIQDLERNNQRLVQENINDKKHIKSLYETIESLESRCEDLQHIVDDMGHLKKDDSVTNSEENVYGGSVNDDQDNYSKLVSQLEHAKNQKAKEQRKVSELEQNVSLLMQENTNLEEKVCVLQQKDEELKTLQDQIVYLEEIRQGNLCRRCQRNTDQNQFDEYSMYDDDDDTDDISAIGSYVETHKHEVLQQLQETLGENYSEDNPYRILVDKYEALLKIQQKHNAFTSTLMEHQKEGQQQQNHGISLHEELQMSGQFSSFNGNALTDSEDEEEVAAEAATHAQRPSKVDIDGGARCKYSETETTSSSGFSDETSNKCTQTETFFTGSFLCTISDGDDCRFSIYDDASPVESRFRKTPEYRQLFREIFAVLKRAAEAKDEGERLPLLQDTKEDETFCEYEGTNDCDGDGLSGLKLRPETMSSSAGPKVPPATPACENNPLVASILQQQSEAGDDSSQMQQQQQAEPSANAAKHDGSNAQKRRRSASRQVRSCKLEADESTVVADDEQQSKLQQQPKQQQPIANKQTRRQRDIIEELASTVKHKKHARHHRKSATSKSRDISHLMEFKWTDQVTRRQRSADSGSADDRSPSHRATWCVPNDAESSATPYASAASQEVAKLKLLEKSYAEVLRLRKPPSNRPQSQYFNRMMH